MIQHNLPAEKWHKSSYSKDNGGNCVETQLTDAGSVALGDSKDRARGAFVFSRDAWVAFIRDVKSDPLCI